MSALIAFIVRLVGYGLLVGIPYRIADYFWQRAALDQVDELRAPHDQLVFLLAAAPVLLALVGFGPLRRPAIFLALYLAGAVLTAPFVFARLAPAG